VLGAKAFFIQSETNIVSRERVEHYVYVGGSHGHTETRPLWPASSASTPKRVLITGGASCPDGIIQQVITRINGFFPADQVRPVEAVLRDLERT
jgi:4-hydroxy-3-methylbut-2-enyl diphosphate reductase